MKKLLKFKKWLTIADTARHLSIVLGDAVSEADVLQLALDGHLKISVYFVNRTFGRRCWEVNEGDKFVGKDVFSADGDVIVRDYYEAWGGADGTFVCEKHVVELEPGVYGLSLMTAGGQEEVQRKRQVLNNWPEMVKLADEREWVDESVFVVADDGRLYKLQSHVSSCERTDRVAREPYNHDDNFSPATQLPTSAVFVVQTKYLNEFEQAESVEQLSSVQKDKALSSTERTTLLAVIAVLCKKSGIDPGERSSASTLVRLACGMNVSISDDTVRRVFKQMADAVGARTK